MNCIICSKPIHRGLMHERCRNVELEDYREEIMKRRKAVEMTRKLIEECTAKANERTARMMIIRK